MGGVSLSPQPRLGASWNVPILRSGGVMSVSSYGSRSRLSTCFLTKPPFLRAYTVASPSCSTSASSPPAAPSSPSASEQQTMRRPHLLDGCSLHCGSLAASIAVVDGSPAQRASASHLIRCMTERGPRACRVERREGDKTGPR